MNIENFTTAFHTGTAGAVRTCQCGITYYNSDSMWDFAEGEIQELEKDPKAISLDYSVETVSFEGKEYVLSCDCWHERAEQIMIFIDSHMQGIAKYFKQEKQRKQKEVDNIPDSII